MNREVEFSRMLVDDVEMDLIDTDVLRRAFDYALDRAVAVCEEEAATLMKRRESYPAIAALDRARFAYAARKITETAAKLKGDS